VSTIHDDQQANACGLDIYIAMVSSTHNVCAKDIYVAIVSTVVETAKPETEIVPGLQLLGPISEK
jgi:Rab GDP dissociation inhibitor